MSAGSPSTPATTLTAGGAEASVSVCGPDRGSVVVLLGAATTPPHAYEALCRRLHTASLRTVVIGGDRQLTAASVVGILDDVAVRWSLLVGDRAGGELAWQLAANRLDRFTGLVSVDRGHPRVPDTAGAVLDEDCGPVELDVTAVVSNPAAGAVARASARWVHGDFRLAELPGGRGTAESTAALAAEIVLRTTGW